MVSKVTSYRPDNEGLIPCGQVFFYLLLPRLILGPTQPLITF